MLNKGMLMASAFRPASTPPTFPTVLSRTTRSNSTTATIHNTQLPSGIENDDLCIILVAGQYSDAVESQLWNVPAGWTQLVQASGTPSAPRRLSVGWFARPMDGTESGTNVQFSTANSNSFNMATIIWHIDAGSWFGGAIADSVAVSAVTQTLDANSPSFAALMPPWGALDYLWIASGGAGDDDTVWTASANNYGNLTSIVSGGGSNNGCSVGSCERELNASSEAPGNMIIASSETWRTVTIAIRPPS